MSSAMKWKKLGKIFCPSGDIDWMSSHASVPIANLISEDTFKIYFSSRDSLNRSHTGYVIINLNKINKIINLCEYPILTPGDIGTFDDSGAMATWLTKHKGREFLYYIGWNLGITVPFRNSIGLAISDDQNKFVRYSSGPIMDRTTQEPHFCASCCVLPSEEYWRMWYLSCTEWRKHNKKIEHRYHIKYAESSDGINWLRKGVVAIDYKDENEYAISRPSVIHDKDIWRMWYSYRGDSYRIGYAESDDGIHWNRLDQLAGISVSPNGWDSEMICYPYVFDHKGERYMLYNGNGYGKTGFGLAILEQD